MTALPGNGLPSALTSAIHPTSTGMIFLHFQICHMNSLPSGVGSPTLAHYLT